MQIVLRLSRLKSGKWRVGTSATQNMERTRYNVTSSADIKSLPDGLFAAGRVIENTMLPHLAGMLAKHESPSKKD
jgi:hypothetical protein